MTLPLFDYPAAFAAGPGAVGGKAWNLARLARWGYVVPPGMVLGGDDYARLLADPALAPLVEELAACPASAVQDPVWLERLSRLHAAIRDMPFSRDDLVALDAALASACLSGVPLAVRSSAVGEDGERHAFAGIHDSVLNVADAAGVARAIRACQASLWTPRALAYRRRFDLPDAETVCAVLICAMVRQPEKDVPLAAGVAFSADPADGHRDRIVIEAVAGLADRLVAGEVQPARYLFRMDWLGLAPLETAREPLTGNQALRLARLVERLHWTLGEGDTPQDIEWAFDGERFVVVQARPVTALPHLTFPGLAGQPVHWSNANLKEVLPGVLTPLTWSVMYAGVRHILFDPAREAGIAIPEGMPIMRRILGRAYFDLSAMQWAYYDGFGVPPADITRDLGGGQPEIAVPPGNPLAGSVGRQRSRRQLHLILRLWNIPERIKPLMRDLHRRARAIDGDSLARLDKAALLALWRDCQAELPRFPSQLANTASSTWVSLARRLLLTRLPPQRAEALLARLLAGSGEMTSAEHGYRLRELAQLRTRTQDVFEREWRRFLDEFGHRGFDECELANPRWREQPQPLLDFLATLRHAGHDRTSAQRVRASSVAELKALPLPTRLLLQWLGGKARAGLAAREASKSCLVALMGAQRALALEAGRRLVAEGHLDEPQDIFMLSQADLRAWLENEWDGSGARMRALDARRERERLLALPPPPDVISSAQAGTAPTAPACAAHGDGRSWQGVAVAPGKVVGKACRIAHPDQGATFPPGAILVARATDPGWTPLFLLASGIAVEIGGYLSHGAIVAREFGIPAVLNLPGIFDTVNDGDELAVDGDAGQVTRLE